MLPCLLEAIGCDMLGSAKNVLMQTVSHIGKPDWCSDAQMQSEHAMVGQLQSVMPCGSETVQMSAAHM